ncbi:RluA family pseudouridine synthase [Marinicrinis lubricantis]|uniref:RNA pseudouridylate synthase n=1 Tax=Marinicrinis lubricantis TaxID=2086470 RepID=A0ABW1ILT3_9BACL
MPPLTILYEDNHLLSVVKPPNMPTQEDSTGDADLLSEVKNDIKVRHQKPGNVFVGLVHRLDRPVGGVMIFAKTSKAASRLSDQIRTHTFKKTYLAIVRGEPAADKEELVHYLRKDSKTNTVHLAKPQEPDAKKAILSYVKGPSRNGLTIIAVHLKTGRPHQIRVQLSAIGFPLYGDQKYGAHVNKPGQQIALWSSEIGFEHPTKKSWEHIRSLPPVDDPWTYWTEREMLDLLQQAPE